MSCTPVLVQDAFRGRNDDGTETTATYKGTGADNQNWTQNVDENFRIRLHVQVTNACAATNRQFQLEYSLDGGSWTPVNNVSSVVRSVASIGAIADGATTTDQLTTGSGSFIGLTAYDEVDGLVGGSSLDLAASGHTEVEFCVQILSADVTNGQTVQLRVSATNLDSWTSIPSVTVSELAPAPTPSVNDSSTATDAIPANGLTLSSSVALNDAPTATDAIVDLVFITPPITVSLFDTPTVVDLGAAGLTIGISESVTVELITAVVAIDISDLFDAPTASDVLLDAVVKPLYVSTFDAPTATDAIVDAALKQLTPSVFDAPTATDALVTAALKQLTPSVFDTPTATDAVVDAVLKPLYVSVFDGPTVTDAIVQIAFGAAAPMPDVFDTATATDSLVAATLKQLNVDVFEAPTVTDAHGLDLVELAVSLVTYFAQHYFHGSYWHADYWIETATAPPANIEVSVFDGPTITDAIVQVAFGAVAPTPSVFDAPTATDSLVAAALKQLNASVADSPTATDALITAVLKQLTPTVFDTPAVTDVIDNLTFAGADPTPSIYDSSVVTDSYSLTFNPIRPSVFDGPTVTESATLIVNPLRASVFDGSTVTDAIVALSFFAIAPTPNVYDAPTVTESVDLFMPVIRFLVTDAPTATDAVSMAAVVSKVVADAPTATENVDFTSASVFAVSDLPTATDLLAIVLPQLNIFPFDDVAVSDYVEFTLATADVVPVLVADQVDASDDGTLVLALPASLDVNIYDSPAVSDALTLAKLLGLYLNLNGMADSAINLSAQLGDNDIDLSGEIDTDIDLSVEIDASGGV